MIFVAGEREWTLKQLSTEQRCAQHENNMKHNQQKQGMVAAAMAT